jgi:hypothetical protein
MTGRIIGMLPISGEVWVKYADEPPAADWVRAFVGGDVRIECVTIAGEPCQLVCNRDAFHLGACVNRQATAFWQQQQSIRADRPLKREEWEAINGPALVLTGPAQLP